jgi:hypothetical protein
MSKLKRETRFIEIMISNVLDGLDDTPYKLTKAQKAKALKVLEVKKPNRDSSNCSKAGRNRILINLSYWQIKNVEAGVVKGFRPITSQTKDGHVYWREYKSFDNDPRCGGMFVKNGDVDHGNLIQVTHEMAHYVQYTLWHSDKSRWAHMRQPHGEGFKQIYRILRDRFVNSPQGRERFLWKCNYAENREYVG